MKICLKGSSDQDGFPLFPQLEKDILGQILNHVFLPDETGDGPAGNRVSLPEEFLQSASVSLPETGQYVSFLFYGAYGLRGFLIPLRAGFDSPKYGFFSFETG
jgi:hypothetical protein